MRWEFVQFKSTIGRNFSKVKKEEGSISVLIIGLFSLAFILSMGIMNVSESYIAKRQLIQIGEEVVQRSTHSLDYSQYYLSDRNWESTHRIPLDCAEAIHKVVVGISEAKLKGQPIEVSQFGCRDGLVRVRLHSEVAPILQFPLFKSIIGEKISIDAEVEAGTYLGQSN